MTSIPAVVRPAKMARSFLDKILAPIAIPEDPSLAIDIALASKAADISEAKGMVGRLEREIENAKGGDRLASPGCEQGCAVCFRTCAVARIKLAWWQKELTSLVGGLR